MDSLALLRFLDEDAVVAFDGGARLLARERVLRRPSVALDRVVDERNQIGDEQRRRDTDGENDRSSLCADPFAALRGAVSVAIAECDALDQRSDREGEHAGDGQRRDAPVAWGPVEIAGAGERAVAA